MVHVLAFCAGHRLGAPAGLPSRFRVCGHARRLARVRFPPGPRRRTRVASDGVGPASSGVRRREVCGLVWLWDTGFWTEVVANVVAASIVAGLAALGKDIGSGLRRLRPRVRVMPCEFSRTAGVHRCASAGDRGTRGRPVHDEESRRAIRGSRTLLSEVLNGRRLPPAAMLKRLFIAADLDIRTRDRLVKLWEAARAETMQPDQEALRSAPRVRRSGSSQPVPQFGQPDPIRVSNPVELTQALRAVHVWAGEPSLRKLEARSGGKLRRSSVSDMLRGTTLPEYDRFIACGFPALIWCASGCELGTRGQAG